MAETFGATFSAPDLVSLTEALIDAAPYAGGMPAEMFHKLASAPPTADWRRRMLADDVDGLSVAWGPREKITRNPGAVAAGFPSVPLDPKAILDLVAPLPFEVAVMPPVHNWQDDYFAPAIGADHALLGWGMMFKGAGHDNAVVSRRWLDHGPSRLLRGANDTTFVQFHQLDVEERVSMEQARAGHEWMVAGFIRPKHRYKHDIAGLYTEDDRLLRIVVNDRTVSDVELLDACAARRDRRADPDQPIKNVAYVFADQKAAKERLDALWLRELECRAIVKGKEIRLDDSHSVEPKRPRWVAALEGR
jgi:hypothetical protein